MHCMKCGREIDEGHVFCPDCLTTMERYPVKPGTAVHIPVRKDPPRKTALRKKPLTPEEQNLRLRKKILNTELRMKEMMRRRRELEAQKK